MWVTVAIVGYLSISFVAALVFYCAAAMSSRTIQGNEKTGKTKSAERQADYSVLLHEV